MNKYCVVKAIFNTFDICKTQWHTQKVTNNNDLWQKKNRQNMEIQGFRAKKWRRHNRKFCHLYFLLIIIYIIYYNYTSQDFVLDILLFHWRKIMEQHEGE